MSFLGSIAVCREEIRTAVLKGTKDHQAGSSSKLYDHSMEISKVDREDQQLNFAEAEMGEVKEENERLKMLLARASKDYKSLQMHFFDILHQEKIRCTDSTVSSHQEKDELELVSLSLGITSTDVRKDETKNRNLSNGRQEDEKFDGKLSLGLDCRFDPSSISTVNRRNSSSINSFEELKEEEPTEIWPPSKLSKTLKNADDQVLQRQSPLKKARFSVRARCDTPTMNDGCRWRKYGQKIAKGNPFPRGYYRCNVSSSCPVRKQVQRCVDDMSILITTYEGKHDHPLPISASAMASTTSAAASTLQSRSSSSHDEALIGTSAIAPISTSSTPSTTLRGFNFTLSQSTSRPQQFYIPNSSISTSNLYPSSATVDLTTAPSTSRPFGRFSSSFSSVPRYSSTGLNFSSSSSSSLEPHTLQTHWNGHTGYNNHGTLAYNKNHIGHPYLNTTGRKQPFQEYLYQP